MFDYLKSLLPKGNPATPQSRLPAGKRVYAVGDIHGRCDLFATLIKAIEADDAAAKAADTTIILLGDLVDRGPDSAGVVRAAREWQARRRVRILLGNHEEMFLKSFDNLDLLRHFLRHGGRETLLSYGLQKKRYNTATIEDVQKMMHEVVSEEERAFITGFEDMITLGDYLFVHAGVVPGVPIADQKVEDLRWIREPFLSHTAPYEAIVVHGHTITDAPVETSNRIGIDTGAYASGRLTALVLEGAERRYITAVGDELGQVRIEAS